MNLLSGVPSFGLGANHRAKSRGDPGHMNPFEDNPKPKPPPKMTEKDSIRSYNFISDLAKAGAIAFAMDTGITENTTRAQIRGNHDQEKALALATDFAAYALGRAMNTMDLSKYDTGSSPVGSYIKESMNLKSSDESDSSVMRKPVGEAFIAARNLAQFAAKAKAGMDQLIGFINAPARVLIHATQETQLGVSSIAGSFASSVKTLMPILKTKTQMLKLANSARAASKSGFVQWVSNIGTKSPARVVAKPQLNIDNAPAVDFFSPFDTGLDLQYKLGVAEHKLRVESQIGNQASYREALNNYMSLAAKAGVMVSQSQIPPPPSNIITGGYITSGGGNISNPIVPQTIQPSFQPTQPPPVLNPTQFAGLGEAPEATTWLWIMAGAAALYLIMEPETRLSRK